MTTIRDELAMATQVFAAAGIDNPRGDAVVLLAAATGWDRATLVANSDRKVPPPALDTFRAHIARRLTREPVSHILGEREFWSLPFHVTAATLAPRPDSETVIEAALATIKDRAAPLRLLDLGAGTGCLLLALLHELPNASGIGIEKSPAAAQVAEDNARRLGLGERARIIVADWAAALDPMAQFDVMVSNPPYIAETDRPSLPPEVALYEPAAALFAGPDGLDAYRVLLPLAARHLTPGGVVVVELGHGQRPAVAALAQDAGLQIVECRRDLGGIERALALKSSREKSCGSAK